MNEVTGTSSSRRLDVSATTSTALAPSSAEFRGGQGAGGKPPPPQFNLPDSYWAQTPYPRTRDLPDLGVSGLIARHLHASSASTSNIAKIFEKINEDRENDPRSRGPSWVTQAHMAPVQFPDLLFRRKRSPGWLY